MPYRFLQLLALVGLLLLLATSSAQELPQPATPAKSQINYTDAFTLGLVEGITEYLPISSTGHLLLTNTLLGLDAETPMTNAEGAFVLDDDQRPYTLKRAADAYIIIIQGGAILAVVVLYWRRLLAILRGLLGRDAAGLRLGLNILVAFMPAVVLGLLLDEWIESKLFGPLPIAFALAAGAILMWSVEHWRKRRQSSGRPLADTDLPQMTYRQCLIIGLLQCIAMWPGTSRSMMTIVGGYWVGLNPRRAAEFSFLLGLITLSAAASYKTMKDGRSMLEVLDAGPLLFGGMIAFVSAVLAVKWLVSYLTKHGLSLFAWYRLVLAAAILVWYYAL